jgi:hypothetical protein
MKTLGSDKHFQQSSGIQNKHKNSVAFLYTNNEQAEKEIRKNNPIHNSLKKLHTQ